MVSTTKLIRKSALYLVVAVGAFLTVSPFLWMLLSSFKNSTEIFSYPPTILPNIWRVDNYAKLFIERPFGTWYLNSILPEMPEPGHTEEDVANCVDWFFCHQRLMVRRQQLWIGRRISLSGIKNRPCAGYLSIWQPNHQKLKSEDRTTTSVRSSLFLAGSAATA